jgi:hypothetical protein
LLTYFLQKEEDSKSGFLALLIHNNNKNLTDVATAPLTTQKSSESHIVDVTNKSMFNRYLRVFHPVLNFMMSE